MIYILFVSFAPANLYAQQDANRSPYTFKIPVSGYSSDERDEVFKHALTALIAKLSVQRDNMTPNAVGGIIYPQYLVPYYKYTVDEDGKNGNNKNHGNSRLFIEGRYDQQLVGLLARKTRPSYLRLTNSALPADQTIYEDGSLESADDLTSSASDSLTDTTNHPHFRNSSALPTPSSPRRTTHKRAVLFWITIVGEQHHTFVSPTSDANIVNLVHNVAADGGLIARLPQMKQGYDVSRADLDSLNFASLVSASKNDGNDEMAVIKLSGNHDTGWEARGSVLSSELRHVMSLNLPIDRFYWTMRDDNLYRLLADSVYKISLTFLTAHPIANEAATLHIENVTNVALFHDVLKLVSSNEYANNLQLRQVSGDTLVFAINDIHKIGNLKTMLDEAELFTPAFGLDGYGSDYVDGDTNGRMSDDMDDRTVSGLRYRFIQ